MPTGCGKPSVVAGALLAMMLIYAVGWFAGHVIGVRMHAVSTAWSPGCR